MFKRCKRTRKRSGSKSKGINNKKEAKNKNKLTCCQRCRRKIRIWCCRKLKRGIKRKIFGYADPELEDFEIAGYNLGSIRDKFRYNKSTGSLKKSKEILTEKKPTVLTIYKKNIFNTSKKSIPMKDTILDEVDRYSFSKSTGKKLQSYLGDFKENYPFIGVTKNSLAKLNSNASEKERLKKISDNKDFIKSIDTLKKRFSLTLSKAVILKNIIDDYKNKKYSFTGVIDKSKYNKSNFDVNDFDKKDLNKIISHYKIQKKSKVQFMDKKFSIRELEIMNKLDAEGLKKKFSLTNSRHMLLKDMIEDHKNEKLKSENSKMNFKKIYKENLNKILDYYKSYKDKKRFSFIKQSRIRQMKSDLMAKLNSVSILN